MEQQQGGRQLQNKDVAEGQWDIKVNITLLRNAINARKLCLKESYNEL